MTKVGIGQDSHRFEPAGSLKPLKLGGVVIPGHCGLAGNSDADVILHALTNAISGISGENIIGRRSDEMCFSRGITDSAVYLAEAIKTLRAVVISHVSVSVEGARPRLSMHIPVIRESIACRCGIDVADVGMTATTGEDLTAFGRGEGLAATVIVTATSAIKRGRKRPSRLRRETT